MHAKLAAVVSSLLLVVLSGCVSGSAKLDRVHLGMTKTEVVALLGQPDSTTAQANTEYLTYYLRNNVSDRDQPYMIRLIDAKVESFGRFIQLLDVHTGPANGVASLGIGAIMPYAVDMDVVTQLQQLKALEEQGVLTAEEVQRAKQRLFSKRD